LIFELILFKWWFNLLLSLDTNLSYEERNF